MSLRREIHSAFDVIAPPLGGMPERMVQTVLAEQKARGRKRTMLLRLRAPLSLVAVFLLVALVAAVLVGGRLIQDWNAFHKSTPVNHTPLATLAELEARPLTLPKLTATEPCPQDQGNTRGYGYGSGPVYAAGGPAMGTDWGLYWTVLYFTDANLKGLVLIRGQDLRDHTRRVVFVGNYVAGPVVGNDPATGAGAQHEEIVLDASNPPSRYPNKDGMWTVRQGLAPGTNCVGFQIDGSNFTEKILPGP